MTDELARGGIAPWTGTATAGANVGNFRIGTTVRHRAAYKPTNETPRLATQTKIPGFTVVDLALRYEFEGDDWFANDLAISLNINNVFDEHPPLSFTAAGGVTGGQTIGRAFIIGFNKRFGGSR